MRPRLKSCRISRYQISWYLVDVHNNSRDTRAENMRKLVEAKKLSLGPQNVLSQAERYSRGLMISPLDFRGFRVHER